MEIESELICELYKASSIVPEVPLARVIAELLSSEDMLYCSNEEFLCNVKSFNQMLGDGKGDRFPEVSRRFFISELQKPLYKLPVPCSFGKQGDLNKEREMLSYDRYMYSMRDATFFSMTIELSYFDFAKQLRSEQNWDEEELKWFTNRIADLMEYKVINHVMCLQCISDIKYVPLYIVGKKDSKWIFYQQCTSKYPEYYELIEEIKDFCSGLEGCFTLVLNASYLCPPEYYAKNTLFGVHIKDDKKEIELIDQYHAVERFHALFQKCEKGYDCNFDDDSIIFDEYSNRNMEGDE